MAVTIKVEVLMIAKHGVTVPVEVIGSDAEQVMAALKVLKEKLSSVT